MRSIYFISLNMIPFVPYNYGILRSYIEQNRTIAENYRWHEPLWKFEPIEKMVSKIQAPDILCASSYIWNHNNHLEIAKQIKKKYPDCKIIFGGPQIPDASEEYFSQHPWVDILVHGEGEIPLEILLTECLKDHPEWGHVPNISFSQEGPCIKNSCGHTLPKNLPILSPYLLGFFDHFLDSNRDLAIGFLETSRGCPFSCAYCDWGVNTMSKIRVHDLEKIYQEIEFIGKHRIKDLYISDPNFGILARDLDIAQMLVETKKKFGYPQALRLNTAKNTSDRVFRISKMLYDNEMLWSTTLSVQSLNKDTVQAIKRKNINLDQYKELNDRYNAHGIPNYAEIILGLPLETRESFIDGICKLLSMGVHNDIRLFQLSLLPNAPLSQRAVRKKYGLKTKWKPLRMVDKKRVREDVELVFETSTLSLDDWMYCTLFSEMIQAFHNGGYTQFLSRYLNEENILAYKDFYSRLLSFMLTSDAPSFRSMERIRKLLGDFRDDPDIPETPKILDQTDIVAFLKTYNPKRKGWRLYVYLWLSISEAIEDFYGQLKGFIKEQGIELDDKIVDLLKYQKEIMITLNYDPEAGKRVSYRYNWFGYFFTNEKLDRGTKNLHYRDSRMGPGHRYKIVKNEKHAFLVATNGYAYPYSRFRLFFHQPDATERLD